MAAPSYCTQNKGDCRTCSLSNYGRDCQNRSIAAREMGALKSPAKAAASRANLAGSRHVPPRKPRCQRCQGKRDRCAECKAKD